jgi:hypothetical protein
MARTGPGCCLQVAVVLPVDAVKTRVAPGTEAGLALLFGATSIATTLNIK